MLQFEMLQRSRFYNRMLDYLVLFRDVFVAKLLARMALCWEVLGLIPPTLNFFHKNLLY